MSQPDVCQTALKEWASVIWALEQGNQVVLIRKGGLIEPGSGFEWASRDFLFYPTFEHQTVNFVREPYRSYLEQAQARKPSSGRLQLTLYGQVAWSVKTTEPDAVERLRAFHIYHEAFVQQRLRWQPDQPLVIAAVRAFRLPQPIERPLLDRYAGCKSWVELEQPVSVQAAVPVLDDQAFADQLQRIQSHLQALSSASD